MNDYADPWCADTWADDLPFVVHVAYQRLPEAMRDGAPVTAWIQAVATVLLRERCVRIRTAKTRGMEWLAGEQDTLLAAPYQTAVEGGGRWAVTRSAGVAYVATSVYAAAAWVVEAVQWGIAHALGFEPEALCESEDARLERITAHPEGYYLRADFWLEQRRRQAARLHTHRQDLVRALTARGASLGQETT